ncbi:LysR substrate-binding domain-containing protein [Roseiarcaceae bacterium H3SJ34-1]|uniref:LysR substrate-binding domain-containing protein n=1 Tax=Terripilifer ovatus TaxID=3032367 RepID=UPI003AB9444A|nr:LysR substrate-binding domain-containing protein [Roseiarcaceae bacterium H3SJ34-1]
MREGYAAETLDWLGNGQIDIGVVYNPPQITTLIVEKIADDTLHLVGAPGSLGLLPGSVFPARMLGSLPLVLPPQPHRLRSLVDLAAREAHVELQTVVEATGTLTVLELVRAGLGYTVLPSILVEGEAQGGRLQSWPLTEPDIHPCLCIATSMQRPQTESTRAVLKTIANILRDRSRG